MGHEVNIDPISALEKQIAEGKGDTIELKRARNSLLNISTRVPPEILGSIFIQCVARERNRPLGSQSHFDGLRKGSYNFLLVCHHWFKVASRTPELWSFWGNTVSDWNKRYRRSGAAPLDLVLDGGASHSVVSIDDPLQDALRDHAAQDNIRQIHIRSCGFRILSPIISSLTPDGGGVQEKRIESIILRGLVAFVEVTDFFARVRLPKLRYLDIAGTLLTSPWDNLGLQTTHLTTLALQLNPPSPAPTASQLFSVIASNPNLQELVLAYEGLPDDIGGSAFRVPLRHVKAVSLQGEFRRVFGLLGGLELPTALDSIQLDVDKSTTEDILQTLGPYVRDHLRRDIRFQDRLRIFTSFRSCLAISASPVDDRCHQILWSDRGPPFANFVALMADPHLPDPVMEKLHLDFMAFTPQERVVCLETMGPLKVPEELFVAMPNIETLWLDRATLSEGFLQPTPDGPHANTKLLPSLRHLRLRGITPNDDGLNHLTTYLAHQTSGGQVISLEVSGCSVRMRPGTVGEIKKLVKAFIYHPNPEIEDEENQGEEDGEEWENEE